MWQNYFRRSYYLYHSFYIVPKRALLEALVLKDIRNVSGILFFLRQLNVLIIKIYTCIYAHEHTALCTHVSTTYTCTHTNMYIFILSISLSQTGHFKKRHEAHCREAGICSLPFLYCERDATLPTRKFCVCSSEAFESSRKKLGHL